MPADSLPPPSRAPGELLDGRYRIEESIGRGGHGVVYKAYDEKTQTYVALKFLHREFAADPEYNVRMLREAQACSKLAGTAAIQIHALRSDSTGALFIVMEFLAGEDLNDHISKWEDKGKFFPLDRVAAIFDPIARTLDAAHVQGIVHRDLKPGNVFITEDGGVRLLDFGLAKVMSAKPLTREGMVAGSPSYIAPEAWKGDPRKLDHRIDVYSLGALLFRVLAGRPPFMGNLIELMQASLGGERPSLRAIRPEFPAQVDEWVKEALAIDANQRFVKAGGCWAALRSILSLGDGSGAKSDR